MKEYKDNKKIKIVEGDPDDIEISEVKDNLAFEVENKNTPKKGNIIIPKNKK
ncbi:MAG: hypothetical protein IKG14_03825 [Clostridia bacterium]|nr:hypothetical protein [Clostridia bacterium]